MSDLRPTIIACLISASLSQAACHNSSEAAHPVADSVTMTTEQRTGNAAVTRPATRDEIERVERVHEAIEAVDKEFPPSPVPRGSVPLHTVVAVKDDGVLVLNDGTRVRLDGIKCSPKGVHNLAGLLMSETTRITFRAPTTSNNAEVSAEVWVTEVSSPTVRYEYQTYSLIADTALVSGWCKPEKTSTSSNYERYVALSKLASAP